MIFFIPSPQSPHGSREPVIIRLPLVLCFARSFRRSFLPRAPAHAPSPRGYPRLGSSAATILPSIPSPLLFPHHANTLPADLILRDPECSRIASSLSLPHPTPSRAYDVCLSGLKLLRQTAVSTAPTRLRYITFALASRVQVPACLRLTHIQRTLHFSPPHTQPAFPACSSSGHDYWRATPDMCTVA